MASIMAKKSRSKCAICGVEARLNFSPNCPHSPPSYFAQCEADIGGLLRLKSAAPIKPRKPQISCDIGLFSDEADQLDLVSWFTEQSEE
jgi:hypothetical protein